MLRANLEGRKPCVHLWTRHLIALQEEVWQEDGRQDQNDAPEERPRTIVGILTRQ